MSELGGIFSPDADYSLLFDGLNPEFSLPASISSLEHDELTVAQGSSADLHSPQSGSVLSSATYIPESGQDAVLYDDHASREKSHAVREEDSNALLPNTGTAVDGRDWNPESHHEQPNSQEWHPEDHHEQPQSHEWHPEGQETAQQPDLAGIIDELDTLGFAQLSEAGTASDSHSWNPEDHHEQPHSHEWHPEDHHEQPHSHEWHPEEHDSSSALASAFASDTLFV